MAVRSAIFIAESHYHAALALCAAAAKPPTPLFALWAAAAISAYLSRLQPPICKLTCCSGLVGLAAARLMNDIH